MPARKQEARPDVPDPDVLAQAVTDFTADPGSLVEALDDLGESAAYSAAGYGRLAALAAECAATPGGRCPSLSARSSARSGSISRYPPGPAATR